jgi:hypothetical protein
MSQPCKQGRDNKRERMKELALIMAPGGLVAYQWTYGSMGGHDRRPQKGICGKK